MGVLIEGMERSFPYLGVEVGGNGMGRKEHSFLSIPLKPQIFTPLKLGEIWGNEIRFNDFFIKTPKILLYIQPFILK